MGGRILPGHGGDTSPQESPPSATARPFPIRLPATMNSWIMFRRPASITSGTGPIRPMAWCRTGARPARPAASPRWDLGSRPSALRLTRWIARTQAVARVLTTLNTFLKGPQGPGTTGIIGYQGWFYHFLDMNTALRAGLGVVFDRYGLLLAGILYAKQYFNGTGAD